MNRCEKLSLLIIDDQPDVLEVYDNVLTSQLGHRVECAQMPSEALRHVMQRLFDIVIIDAKLTYRGAALGGLLLADEVSRVLGIGSVILMSQYDVREEVRHFNPSYTFLPKPRDGAQFQAWVTRDLMNRIRGMVQQQYGFVAMPFSDPKSTEWYRAQFGPWMREAGFEVRRMDEIPTTRPINHELLGRIRESHFVVFYHAVENPNVYFEAGFASACDKYVVILTPDKTTLPFDIRSNYAIEIDKKQPESTRSDLLALMSGLRGM